MTYTLVTTGTRIQITATASGADHLIEIPADDSAAYTVGKYHYQAHVAKGVEKYEVDAGTIEIGVNFAEQESGYDARSHVKKILDDLEDVMEGRANKVQMSQTIGGVDIQYATHEQISELRDKYRIKYAAERAAVGKGKITRTLKPRFRS